MSSGIIKTKTGAQDGDTSHSDGTIQEDTTNTIYAYKGQTLGSLKASSSVTFTTSRGSDGNMYATNIQAKT